MSSCRADDTVGAGLGGQRQLIEQAAGDESDIDAVEHGAEPPAMPASRATMSGNLPSARPVLRVLVLCTIASNRSTRSPLV